ncbi:MAG TPA: GGDEF domain-containing protein [Acidobacteriaceae bacterium]|nr:GGDEF domain-containing protein [Acidobacteriaceae bacterium]
MMIADNPRLLQQADLYDIASTPGPAIEPSARSFATPTIAYPRWLSIRVLFAVCAISLLAQGVLVVVDPQAMVAFNALIALEFLFAAAGCLRCASTQSTETQALWILVASGFFLSIGGQIQDTYDLLRHVQPTTTATMADFFFLIYGIPILLAISFTNQEADLGVLFWLDGAQAIIAAVLIYFQIYSILPSTGHSIAISTTSLMYVYNVENLTLAGAVTLRLFGHPAPAKRRFYVVLTIYLWCYAGVALILGYLELERNLAQGLQDVLWGLPCLLLLGAVLFQPDDLPAGDEVSKDSNRSVALLLDNLSPVLFTLVVVMMGARIAPAYPWIGFASITIAVALYGLRAALLQSKYLRSQEDLASSSRALVDAVDRLQDISIRDGLTGIYNRRHFDEVLLAEWKRSIRTQKPLSLLLIDVDNFKKLNDRYGHPEGDECLKKIADQLSKLLRRSSDTLARYGGEEFVAILPETTKESAQQIADAMRMSVEDLKIKNGGPKAARVVTVSIGVCSENAKLSRPAEELLNAADAALYRAKKQGRNRVQVA